MKHIDKILHGACCCFSALLTYFAPLGDAITVLLVLLSCNFAAGLFAGLLVEHDGFRFKKAWRCLIEITTIFLFLAASYTIGEKKGCQGEVLKWVSFITWGAIYFYACNILRNLKNLFPDKTPIQRLFAFLYYVISVEFVKDIPFLSTYLKNSQN